MSAGERIYRGTSLPGHSPQIQSSSVPSTPHQVPRDLRFPSRSPSPGSALNRQQGRLSEVRNQVSLQSAPSTICKFETGAEFRKRRIGYKDGGNECLPPPLSEPKAHLEPHEDDRLSGDMRELYDRLLPTQESEDRRAMLVQKLETLLNNEWPGSDIEVHVFGSSGNLLSSSDSDGWSSPLAQATFVDKECS